MSTTKTNKSLPSNLSKKELFKPKSLPSNIGRQKLSPRRKKSPSPIRKKSKSPSPKEKYIRKIGPPDNLEKYGLIEELGSGNYGSTYKARNLDRKKGEDKYYAIKVLYRYTDVYSWLKEIKCLIDIMDICTKVGILCYKDSFVFKDEYVIVTNLLEGYQGLEYFLYNHITMKPYPLSEKDAFDIYQQVVDVKNALTDLCINHSDLHFENIMIHPDTKKIQVIDLGKCQTPEEEKEEYKGKRLYSSFSDEARLLNLRRALYNAVKGYDYINLKHQNNEQDEFFSSIKINPSIQNCTRKEGRRELMPKI